MQCIGYFNPPGSPIFSPAGYAGLFLMHLLYLDESGTASDPAQKHFVLAGVSVNERATHWIERELDLVAKKFSPHDPGLVELHGSPMRSGRGGWKQFKYSDRIDAMREALTKGVVAQSNRVRLFGAVVRKASLHGKDPAETAFEQLSSRFDLFLRRCWIKHHDKQRGIIIFDKASTEKRIQTLARDFKTIGHTWGRTTNYAEVPVFLDSQASRLIQLADLVAFALYRFYEHNDNTFYDVIKHRFDNDGGVEHGLYIHL